MRAHQLIKLWIQNFRFPNYWSEFALFLCHTICVSISEIYRAFFRTSPIMPDGRLVPFMSSWNNDGRRFESNHQNYGLVWMKSDTIYYRTDFSRSIKISDISLETSNCATSFKFLHELFFLGFYSYWFVVLETIFKSLSLLLTRDLDWLLISCKN